MCYLSLDVRQEDCPLTRTTREFETTFTTPQWHFDRRSGRWELRIHASAAEEAELGGGLRSLRDTESVDRFELYWKDGSEAFARTVFAETSAISTVARHGGYVVGPFRNEGGLERWQLGFDTESAADAALSELDRHEEFAVRSRCRIDERATEPPGIPRGAGTSRLTDREREVLSTALERGYYETPRATTAAELGEELGVSDVAISKTLRRVERKVLSSEMDAITGCGDDSASV